MNIEAILIEKIKKFEDIKNQLGELSKKIGGLTEQQRVLYNQGLELKGAIDGLVELKAKEDADLKASETAKLLLPEGVKPIVASGPTEGQLHAEKQPVTTLEVK